MGIYDGLPKTTNIKLNKPGYDNAADIMALNENADIIDAAIQKNIEDISNIKKGYVKTVNNVGVDSQGNVNVTDIVTGMIIPFAGNGNIPTGFLLCNGASVGKATYPALFAAIGYTYGGSGNYFNLPNLTDKFIEGGRTAGTNKNAFVSVPDHIHAFGYNTGNNNGSFVSTAGNAVSTTLDSKASFARGWNGSGGGSTPSQIGTAINAYSANMLTSLPVSATSGNSVTVQPPALTMRYIIKAFAGAADNSTDLAITNVANDLLNLSTKVNSHVYVRESYRNGTEWYRKWSDGWIEQGGKGVASGYSSNSQTNNLLMPFSNTNYTIVCTKLASNTSAAITVVQKTTTTFNMSCHGQGGSSFSVTSDIEWYACGY